MSSRYEPKNHIQPLVVAPRADGVLDQREITIQSYQTTVPFDHAKLDAGLGSAWLTPQIRFGVFARIDTTAKDSLNVVLGLQDDLTIRAYDYDERRPLWFTWQDAVVDTVNIRYFKDEDGLLRFTTTGGGRRITDDRLHEFNSGFLGIAKDAVNKRQFDLDKLRELCFNRFADRLYMLRFSDPSAEEYHSIDHAMFQSRRYIDPDAERFREISTDNDVTVESFESDIGVKTSDLASEIKVRFLIRGLSGSLRLSFPKVQYKTQLTSPQEEVRVFYQLVDVTASSILDTDYYAHHRRSLDDLSVDLGMFPDMVDLAPFTEVLIAAEARREFLMGIDLAEKWSKWQPHLRAIDELIVSDVVATDVTGILEELVRNNPKTTARMFTACREDAKTHRVACIVATLLARELQTIPSAERAQVEGQLLAWAIESECDSWDVDSETGEFGALGLRWRLDDVAFDALPAILWKLVGVTHGRLISSSDDPTPLLSKFDWCITAAKCLPPHHSKNPAALRLVAEGRVPKSVSEAGRVLKGPVSNLRELDESALNHFGLPLWPLLTASRRNGKVDLTNHGIGTALAATIQTGNVGTRNDEAPAAFDLSPGETVSLPTPGDRASIDVQFEKYGRSFRVALPIVGDQSPTVVLDKRRIAPTTINRKRLASQRECRKKIDPNGVVIGSSPALLEIFERIHHANLTDGPPAVLLLGEPGVGKTHIAELLHRSSSRASKPFEVVNAGGGGGDINLQRGEWIGYGKGHGIQHIDKKGQPGHLAKANNGTLFIDEFASFSSELQAIFLSVLEKRVVQMVGGESFTPDVRCILATNVDLEKAVAAGTFRRDLLDRIPVTIRIPPLRERSGDILLLARKFAGDHSVADRSLIALLRHQWPDNIRGLQRKMASAIARMKTEKAATIGIDHFDLPADIVSEVAGLDEEVCRLELWTLADAIARDEGYAPGSGLQHRAGEIMGVGDGQASKAYKAFGLTDAVSA